MQGHSVASDVHSCRWLQACVSAHCKVATRPQYVVVFVGFRTMENAQEASISGIAHLALWVECDIRIMLSRITCMLVHAFGFWCYH